MITPLALRQMFQTASVESVRAAHEGTGQAQREVMRRLIFDQQMAEDQASVHQVPESSQPRLEDRRGRGGGGPQEGGSEEDGEDGGGGPAGSAERHLDFLA